MYYSPISKRIVIDLIDYFLLSLIISLHLSSYLKSHFSEQQKMKRLKQDLIRRCELVEDSLKPKSFPSVKKFKKITNFSIRGGSNEEVLFKIKMTQQITTFVTYFLGIIENKINQDTKFKIIFIFLRLYLHFLARFWRIYFITDADSPSGRVKIIVIVMGTTTGITLSWVGLSLTLLTHLLTLGLLSKSLAQQLLQILEYRGEMVELRERLAQYLTEQEMKEKRSHMMKKIQDDIRRKKLLDWKNNPNFKNPPKFLNIPELNGSKRKIKHVFIEPNENPRLNNFKNLKTSAEKLFDVKKDLDINIINDSFVDKNQPLKRPFKIIKNKLKKSFFNRKISLKNS